MMMMMMMKVQNETHHFFALSVATENEEVGSVATENERWNPKEEVLEFKRLGCRVMFGSSPSLMNPNRNLLSSTIAKCAYAFYLYTFFTTLFYFTKVPFFLYSRNYNTKI